MHPLGYIYLFVCFAIALFLPHVTAPSVSVAIQIVAQIACLTLGLLAFKTFCE